MTCFIMVLTMVIFSCVFGTYRKCVIFPYSIGEKKNEMYKTLSLVVSL